MNVIKLIWNKLCAPFRWLKTLFSSSDEVSSRRVIVFAVCAVACYGWLHGILHDSSQMIAITTGATGIISTAIGALAYSKKFEGPGGSNEIR